MNGSSSSKNGRKTIHHSTTVVTSVDTADGSSSQMKSHSVTSTPGQENRLVYSTRLTFSQNTARATPGRGVVIYDPRFLPSSTDS